MRQSVAKDILSRASVYLHLPHRHPSSVARANMAVSIPSFRSCWPTFLTWKLIYRLSSFSSNACCYDTAPELITIQKTIAIVRFADQSIADRTSSGALERWNPTTCPIYLDRRAQPGDGQSGGPDEGSECNNGERVRVLSWSVFHRYRSAGGHHAWCKLI